MGAFLRIRTNPRQIIDPETARLYWPELAQGEDLQKVLLEGRRLLLQPVRLCDNNFFIVVV